MAKRPPKLVNGSSLHQLDSKRIPNKRGVYIARDSAGNVLDVGQSKKVGKRIARHERKTCWIDHAIGDVFVEVLRTPYKQAPGRRKVEKALRTILNPKCGEK